MSNSSFKGIPPTVYYDTAIMFIALILLGRYLEAQAKKSKIILYTKTPGLAAKNSQGGQRGQKEEDILIDLVQPEDILIVRPGEQIPVDGVVIEGHASGNEAMLTGESLPIKKKPGSKVLTCTLNKSGSILFTASYVEKDTVLACIINLVQEAQSSKPPVQCFADNIASIFVPSDLGIATLVFSLVEPGAWTSTDACHSHFRGSAHHSLPLRFRPDNTDRHHGGNGQRGRTRHFDSSW